MPYQPHGNAVTASDESERLDELSNDDKTLLEKFKERVKEFQQLYNGLINQKNIVNSFPSLTKSYNDLVNRGNSIYNQIEYIKNKINNVYQWTSGVLGKSNAGELGNIGIAPVMATLIGAGIFAYIGGWVSDVYIFQKQLESEIKAREAAEKLIANGMSPTEAYKAVASLRPKSEESPFKSFMVPIAVFGIILLLPTIKDLMSKR